MSAALVTVSTMTCCLDKSWAATLIWDSRDIQVDLDARRAISVSDCCTFACNIFVIFHTPQNLCVRAESNVVGFVQELCLFPR